jgi:hypothetical protein
LRPAKLVLSARGEIGVSLLHGKKQGKSLAKPQTKPKTRRKRHSDQSLAPISAVILAGRIFSLLRRPAGEFAGKSMNRLIAWYDIDIDH